MKIYEKVCYECKTKQVNTQDESLYDKWIIIKYRKHLIYNLNIIYLYEYMYAMLEFIIILNQYTTYENLKSDGQQFYQYENKP